MTRLIVLPMILLMILGGCSKQANERVTVSAASSLRDVFGALEDRFELENPGVDIVVNYAASSLLREQVLAGAPVDVFASANIMTMDSLVDAGVVSGSPVAFATNILELVVPKGNPAGVSGLDDLADDDLLIGLCDVSVPCGALAQTVLASAGVVPRVDTYEPNVRSLLTKIEIGELDAGLVYITDVATSENADAIHLEFLETFSVSYPIAVMQGADDSSLAAEFVAFVASPEARAILKSFGFGP